jgi:hypothetical protein
VQLMPINTNPATMQELAESMPEIATALLTVLPSTARTFSIGSTPLVWKNTACMTMLMRLPSPTPSATRRASTTYSWGCSAASCCSTCTGNAAAISCSSQVNMRNGRIVATIVVHDYAKHA